MRESDVMAHMRVCSRHFPDGDVSKPPNPTLGKILASPMKKREPRAKRARKREETNSYMTLQAHPQQAVGQSLLLLPLCNNILF